MKPGHLILIALTGLAAAGCAQIPADQPDNLEVVAVYTPTPVKIDGVLDDAVWQQAPRYPTNNYNQIPREAGTVQFAWDNQYFYVAAALTDSEIVQYGKQPQSMLFTTGDTFEVFLRPVNDKYYWEIYATPTNLMSSFFFSGPGAAICRLEPEQLMTGLQSASTVNGTVNVWQDRDQTWQLEMAVPAAELTRYGAAFGPGQPWRILIGRYNFSRYLDKNELSGIASFKDNSPSFHYLPSYGYLKLTH